MFISARRIVTLAITAAALVAPSLADGQVRQFQACSAGALMNCAGIRLTSQIGVGPSSTNRIEIGIQNLGALALPGVATSVYFASFLTGRGSTLNPIDVLPAPVAQGGATVSNATPWSLFESGDAIILSPLGNDGVGGCVSGAPVGGFGLMGRTCGVNQFITFSFFTPRLFDLNAIVLSGLEFVALNANNTADSCNDVTPCTIRQVSTVPEPSSLVLLVAGLATIAAMRVRHRTLQSET